MTRKNPLQQWIRQAPNEYLTQLAKKAGTSDAYLRVLAGGHRENPKLRLAMGIVNGVKLLNPVIKDQHGVELPYVTIEDLANINK